jgi:hypothetical protein
MADARNFRKYVEELSGNNFLRKKVKSLEKNNERLFTELAEIKAELKSVKKNMAKPMPKPKGRKPRPMIKIAEDEMAKRKDRAIKVTELVKILKRKKVKSKAQNMYSSVAASLSNSPKFEKVSPGRFRLAAQQKPAKKGKKKSAKK